FKRGETFGGIDIEDVLEFMVDERVLKELNGKFHWMSDQFPAHNISLRSASQENVVIIDLSETANRRVIGEMDRFSAMTLLHEEAIYLHQGIQYQVEELDWEEKKAYVREVDVDYFTDANLAVQLQVLEEDKEKASGFASYHYGDVAVHAMATIFKKIKFETHDNIGSGPIHLPEVEIHTNAAWMTINEGLHDWAEDRIEQGLIGASNAIQSVAPLYAMCDPKDLHVVPKLKAEHNEQPTVFMYDHYAGGIGLAEHLYKNMSAVIDAAIDIIDDCPCENGCPSCTGTDVFADHVKSDAKKVLRLFAGEQP
ncbi:Zn-binding domain-containing protein, partial [Domibacillus epiphyticus]